MDDEVKNLLDDVEFCLRKCIGVYCIKKYRKAKRLSQAALGELLNHDQTTVGHWESDEVASDFRIDSTMSSRLAPTPFTILKFASLSHIQISVMIRDVIAAEERAPRFCRPEILDEIRKIGAGLVSTKQDSGEEKGSDHFERINLLRNSRYLGFICESDGSISHFVMETSAEATKAASIHAYIHLIGKASQVYRCNIVSPPNQMHLYVYMRQDSGKNDRGIMTFWVDTDMQEDFLCGSGVLYSTDRQNGRKRVQWVVILKISENDNPLTINSGIEKNAIYIQRSLELNARKANEEDKQFAEADEVKNADVIVKSILTDPLPAPKGYYMDFECLKERQQYFFESVYGSTLKHLDIESIWKKTHSQREI